MTFSLDAVSVRIGRAELLSEISMELGAGEIVAVVGPNGAGKTTLIGALAADLSPASGTVTLDGRSIADWPNGELARRRAVMRTDGSVAFGFSAREVVLMGRLPSHGGHASAADRALVDALLDAVDVAALADRVFSTLSTGERQRVRLARAIAQISRSESIDSAAAGDRANDGGDRFLLLDEPTSSLDPAHQHVAMRLLRSLADDGLGVLAVLHDLNLAAAYADRIVLMKESRIVKNGAAADIIDAALLERVFDVPMLVVPHPSLRHPLVVARPTSEPPHPGR